MTEQEAKKRLEVWLICAKCPEDKMCYDSYLHSICEYTDYCDEVPIEEAVKVAIEALKREPCEDAISRQAVLDAIMANCIWENEYNLTSSRIKKAVEGLPPVTPQQKVGQWIAIDEEPHEDYECDKCGYTISTYTANIEPHTEYKYCPNCGAKMQEVKE